MHEYRLTKQIVNIVNDAAQKHGAKKVMAAHLVIGENTSIIPDCVQMYFDMIAKGTKAEGAGKAQEFAAFVRDNSDLDVKGIVLGYIQRGGNPSANDRLIAARMGQRAAELLHEGKGGRAVGIRDNQIIDMDIAEALSMPRIFNRELFELNDILRKF